MHRIRLEDGVKLNRDFLRRLNSKQGEVVLKEINELRDAGIIYVIPDSEWVSLIHIFPKRGLSVVSNNKGDMMSHAQLRAIGCVWIIRSLTKLPIKTISLSFLMIK